MATVVFGQRIAVLMDGPYSAASIWSDWEEYPEWCIGLVDEDGAELDEPQAFTDYHDCETTGLALARQHGAEFVNEASERF